MTSRLQTALDYAARGIRVLICAPGGKRPGTANGLDDRTTDRFQLETWFAQADWNIAIVPEDAGWAVVDIDPKHGGELPEDMPETYVVGTPSGGEHWYYRGSLPGSAGKIAPGVDTRGRRSYVLVPPSVVDGNEYRVVNAVPIMGLPAWLAERFAGTEREKRDADPDIEIDTATAIIAARAWLQVQPPATEGSASETLYRYACRLKDLGVSREMAIELLHEFNQGYSPDDIAIRVGNAFKYGQNDYGSDTPRPDDVLWASADMPTPVGEIARPYGWWRDREFLPVRWVLDGLIAEGNANLITGRSKVGKTTFLLNLVVSCLASRSCITRSTGTPGDDRDIVLFAAEDDYGALRDHLHAICEETGADRMVLDRLHIRSLVSEPIADGYLARIDDRGEVLLSRFYTEGLMPFLQTLVRPLVILDPISELISFNRYADQSARRMVTNFCNGMIRGANATLLITDHPSVTSQNSGRDVAGSVQMEAAFPIVLTLKAEEWSGEPRQKRMTLETKFNRHAPESEPIRFYRRLDKFALYMEGNPGTNAQDHQRAIQELIIDGLNHRPQTYYIDRNINTARADGPQYIASLLNIDERDTVAAIKALMSRKLIYMAVASGSGKETPRHLRPVENGEAQSSDF
jgi:hypothetical protein